MLQEAAVMFPSPDDMLFAALAFSTTILVELGLFMLLGLI